MSRSDRLFLATLTTVMLESVVSSNNSPTGLFGLCATALLTLKLSSLAKTLERSYSLLLPT